MVLLSGKNKENKSARKLIDACLENKEVLHEKLLYGNYKDSFSKKIATVAELNMLSMPSGNLGYHFKNTLRISPEYELYHMWYGIPNKYDEQILAIIKENISKKTPYLKIKYMLMLYGSIRSSSVR